MSFTQKRELGNNNNPSHENKSSTLNTAPRKYPTPNNVLTDKRIIYYKVLNGDTLWDIAKKYPGNTIDSLKKLNNIVDGKMLKPGMTIKVSMAP